MRNKSIKQILLYKFCEETYYHCCIVLETHRLLTVYREKMNAVSYDRKLLYDLDSSSFLRFSVETVLIHNAGVSKILFPSTKNEDRGVKIRNFLNISESSNLSRRDLRNSFEHTDERLDKYLGMLEESISGSSLTEIDINSRLSYASSSFGHSENGFSETWFTKEINIKEGRELLSELAKVKTVIEYKFPAIKKTISSHHA